MIVVIGAGPAGLAIAYHLNKRGLSCSIFEKDCIGSTWRNNYSRLTLNTPKQISHLPGLRMPNSYPLFPTGKQYANYLESYVRRFNLNVHEDTEVIGAHYLRSGWQIQTNRGFIYPNILIVCTGTWSAPQYPLFDRSVNHDYEMIHAHDYHNADPYIGKKVLIVGAGNSGTEIAVDLSEHGIKVGLVIRSGINLVHPPNSPYLMQVGTKLIRHLPRNLVDPILSSALLDLGNLGINSHPLSPLDVGLVADRGIAHAIKSRKVGVFPGIQRFTKHGVIFANNQREQFDAIILATGYSPALDIVKDEVEFDTTGYPILNKFQSVTNPALYCVGFWRSRCENWLQANRRLSRKAASQIVTSYAMSYENRFQFMRVRQ